MMHCIFFVNSFIVPVIFLNIDMNFKFPSKCGDNLIDTKNIWFNFLDFSFGFESLMLAIVI